MSKLFKYKLKDCIHEIVEKTTKNNQYEVLSVTKDGIYSQEEFFKKQIASENNIGYKVIRRNNLVFSTMNLWMGSLDVLTNFEIGIVSPAYKIFEFDEKIMLPSFGNYYMKSYYMLEKYKDCSEQGASVVRRNLDLKALLDVDVYIPSIEDQEKYVYALNNTDDLIKVYNSKIDYYKDLIKSQFVEMFENDNTKTIEVGNVADVYDGTHQTPNYTIDGIKFISVENIDNLKATEKYISEEDYKSYKYVPSKGDVFFTRIGTIGRCAIVEDDTDYAYYVSVALLKPKHKIINSIYLKYALECGTGAKEIIKRTLTNATPQKINKDQISKVKIKLADLSKQEQFASVVEQVDKLKFELEKQRDNYLELKKGLLQKMINGNIE